MSNQPYKVNADEGPGAVGYVALVLAWAIPGSGHFLIGQRARAIVFAITIHGLFAFGMLIGGLRAINPPDQAIWTYTEFLAGWPMLVANHLQKAMPAQLDALQQEYAKNRPSIADDEARLAREDYAKKFFAEHPLFTSNPKVQDIGAVYCGIAGMLNLLVIFDVLLRVTGATRQDTSAGNKEPLVGNLILQGSGVANSEKPKADDGGAT